MKILLLLVVAVGAWGDSWMKPVGNGVVISAPKDLRIIHGQWGVVIVLQTQDRNLAAERKALQVTARRVLALLPSRTVIWRRYRILRYQLQMLIQDEDPLFNLSPSRQKRGLLDFIGDASKALFGTATEDDIRSVRRSIAKIRRTNQHIAHFASEFKTVIDHTVKQQNITMVRVEHMAEVLKDVRNLTLDLHRRRAQHDQYDWALERVLYLQHVDAELSRQAMELRRLIEDLERGRLTEVLLPPTILDGILQGYRAAFPGSQPLPRLWYYQNIAVRLTLAEAGQYVYTATLPAAGTDDYFRYALTSFPVPLDTFGNRRRIVVRPDIGYNTKTGDVFVPERCMGTDPVVCTPTVIYNDDRYACEQGLIAAYNEDKKKCEIVTSRGNGSLLFEISGTLILMTPGEEVMRSCPGAEPVKMRLQYGTFRTILTAGCVVTGEGWERTASRRAELNGTLTLNNQRWDEWLGPIPTVPGIILPTVPPFVNTPDIVYSVEPIHLNEDDIEEYYDYGYNQAEVGHHLSWSAIGLIIVIIICVCALAKWLYTRRANIMFYLGRSSKKVTKPTTPETVALEAVME